MSFSLAHLEKLHCWVLAPASPPSSLSQLLRLLIRNNSCTFSFIWRNCRCFYNLPTSALTSVVISTLGRAVSVLTFSSLLRSGNSVSTRVTGCHRLTPAAPSHNSHSSEILSCHYWATVPIGALWLYRTYIVSAPGLHFSLTDRETTTGVLGPLSPSIIISHTRGQNTFLSHGKVWNIVLYRLRWAKWDN